MVQDPAKPHTPQPSRKNTATAYPACHIKTTKGTEWGTEHPRLHSHSYDGTRSRRDDLSHPSILGVILSYLQHQDNCSMVYVRSKQTLPCLVPSVFICSMRQFILYTSYHSQHVHNPNHNFANIHNITVQCLTRYSLETMTFNNNSNSLVMAVQNLKSYCCCFNSKK